MTTPPAAVMVEEIREKFKVADLNDLCDATEAAIKEGGGFGWLSVPDRDVLERYWKGVLVVPERYLFVARLDGVICGSAQIIRPPKNNEAQAHCAQLTTSFIAPWARGHGLARTLTTTALRRAKSDGIKTVNLDVRETQTAALNLYRSLGFTEFGHHPHYAEVNGKVLRGTYFTRDLADISSETK
jgi:ribosomal protein S18 acetylase RimI-like enzyme